MWPFKKKKEYPKMIFSDIPKPNFEFPTIEIPTIKVVYWLTIDECSENECEITKEEVFSDLFSLSRIPGKDEDILFGEGGECLFRVNSVIRSQDKNEITIFGNHIGHDGGIVYRKMVEKHGFE